MRRPRFSSFLLFCNLRRHVCHCEEAPRGRRGNPFPFRRPGLRRRDSLLAKNPGKKQPGASAPGPGARRRCGSGGLQNLTALRARFGLCPLTVGLPPTRHITRPDLVIVAVQWVPKKPHVLPCPIQRLALVGAIHESPVLLRPPYPPKLRQCCLHPAHKFRLFGFGDRLGQGGPAGQPGPLAFRIRYSFKPAINCLAVRGVRPG